MKRSTATLLLLTVFGACVKENTGTVEEARASLPSSENLRIAVPESQGKELGELSDAYVLTRGVTGIVNGGAAIILILAKTVTSFPPTSVEGSTFIWGPWGGNALQPAEYRMTVTRQSDGDYHWTFEGRRKADGAGAPFRTVLNGIATPGESPGHGSGSFQIDFNIAEVLDPVGNSGEGTLAVTYDLESEPKTLDVHWEDVGGDPTASVDYKYSETHDGAGDFQFTALADSEDPGPLADVIEMRSRWNATGAGRADARIASGDNPEVLQVTASECWNNSFALVYRTDSADWMPTVGDPASCAFTSPALPE
jgi:hypothetical protein